MKNIFKLMVIIVFASSCENMRIAHEIKSFAGSAITVPKGLKIKCGGVDTTFQYTQIQTLAKMIVWHDNMACSSCRMKKIDEWNNIVAYSRDSIIGFEPLFIFSPNKDNLYNFELEINIADFDYPILVDYENSFYDVNPHIPQDNKFHVFLIDKNNKVVLIGNPLHNQKLWVLYKQTINKLIANGGVLPEEN